jgi:hypothetical protein
MNELIELRWAVRTAVILQYRTRGLTLGKKPAIYNAYLQEQVSRSQQLWMQDPFPGSDEPVLVPGEWSEWKDVPTEQDSEGVRPRT